MKRFITPVTVLFIVASAFLGCGESEYPLEAERDNGRSVIPVTDSGGSSGNPIVVNLSAGTDFNIGTVTCRLDNDTLYFDYAADEDWLLVATHLDVEETLEEIPMAWPGMPNLFLFPHKKWHFPFVTEYGFAVDLEAAGLDDAVEVYVAAHAFAVKFAEHGWIEHIASAWGEGERFPKLSPGVDPGSRRREMASGLGDLGEGEKLAQIIPEDQRAVMEMEGGCLEDLFRIGRPMYFVVNIRQLRGLLLWNKLGSAEEVENSEVGPDGIIVGDIEHLPGKFGNGFKPLPRTGDHNIPDNYIQYHEPGLGQQGCIEFWYHPDWCDSRVGHCVDILEYGYLEEPSKLLIRIHYNDWQDLLGFNFYDSPISRSCIFIQVRPSLVPQWSTEHPFHIAIGWDGTKPNISDRLTLFFDGIQTGSPTNYGDPTFTAWPSDLVCGLGGRIFSGDWDRHHWEGAEGIIDNIKVWSYPKTDFSDRFEE